MTEPFRDARLTEQRNPATAAIDAASPEAIVRLINAEDAKVPAAVAAASAEIARLIELTEAAFRNGGRLIYVGAGTSGRLGVLDATECPPTYGSPPDMVVGLIAGGPPALVRSVEGAEDNPAAGEQALAELDVTARDVVVGIAASGTTPYVGGALEHARGIGAATALVTCAEPPDRMRDICDVLVVVLVGPEVVTGSTRMKAGTATKLVLNTLTTGAMIRLGKTWGNLMVDLRAWNEKLVDRSERIMMETTRLPRGEARAVLDAAGGRVKPAIVMARRSVSLEEAERLIEDANGRLRTVLGDPPEVKA
ncbi:MAG TPA: N-acetylmuramic acid 6-phosphate etherase [Gemmatimonadales bacterium]|nr:N-acetylmuramic acid 6-phosphate etherase [Gemmatimonadales bacterium]